MAIQLPRGLLQELGHISAVWSEIEQYLILSVSALSSQDFDGEPTGDLRNPFKALRQQWWKETVARLPKEDVDKVFQPINMRLAAASKIRGDLMHGTWSVAGRGKYLWTLWEQRQTLERREGFHSLADLRAFRRTLEALLFDLEAASS